MAPEKSSAGNQSRELLPPGWASWPQGHGTLQEPMGTTSTLSGVGKGWVGAHSPGGHSCFGGPFLGLLQKLCFKPRLGSPLQPVPTCLG